MSTRVEWCEGAAARAALDVEWDELADGVSPFVRSDWLLPWLDAFAGRRKLVVCRVRRGAQLVAAAPLLLGPGQRLAAPVNDHTPSFLLTARDLDSTGRLLEALVSRASGSVRLASLPLESGAVERLVELGRTSGRQTLVEEAHTSPYVDLAGGPQAYRALVKSRVSEHERRRRKLRREHDVETEAVARPEELGRRLDEGLALEAAGWKGEQGSAVLSSPTTDGFYREVARRFDARGELVLSSLRVDGTLAGFDLALLSGGRYCLLKTAYDEQRRRLGPGMVLRLDVLDRCFDLGLDRHDFLGPDMAWKRVFSTGARAHCSVSVFGSGPVGAAESAYRRFVRPLLRTAYRRARQGVEPLG